MLKSTIGAIILLALSADMARAAEPPCLTRGEFSALAGFALPSVIQGATKRCTAVLGPSAYLPAKGGKLVERYAARRSSSWPAAKAAFIKLSATTNDQATAVLRDLPDETLQSMLDLMLEGMVSQEIPTGKCGVIDDYARLLDPLPAQNLAELIALTVGLVGDSEKGKVGKLAICPA